MKNIVLGLVMLGSMNAMALSRSEEGAALKACGFRSVPFLGKYYLAGEYGDKALVMEFLKDVDNDTMSGALRDSGMSDALVDQISKALPATLKKGTVLKFINKGAVTSIVLNGAAPKDISKDAYAGVVRGVKAKIGSDWKQPCDQ